MPRDHRGCWEDRAKWLREKHNQQPGILLRELIVAAVEERNWSVSDTTLSKALRVLGLTQKKTLIATERERSNVTFERKAWAEVVQPNVDPDRFVFIDETWAKDTMTRAHGRSPRGMPLYEANPCRRWTTTTFLGALSEASNARRERPALLHRCV